MRFVSKSVKKTPSPPNQIHFKLIGLVHGTRYTQRPQIGQPKHAASMNGDATIINALIMNFCVMVPKIAQTTPMKGLFVKVKAQQVIDLYHHSFHFYYHFFFCWVTFNKVLEGKINYIIQC